VSVAVIIPVFNGEQWIWETLNAVCAQTLSPTEIVVVDDGSTDASTSIANEYSGVRVLASPGNGPNAARNHGFRETDAEAVAFLDHDDRWHPEHLEWQSRLLEERSQSPAVFASKMTVRGHETPQYSVEGHRWKHHDPWDCFPGNTLGEPFLALIRRSALESVGGWSTQHDGSGDYHLWLKLALHGPLVVSERVTAAYRVHEDSYSQKLRTDNLVRYYTGRCKASRSALDYRHEQGYDAEHLWVRVAAQEALLELLKGFVEGGSSSTAPGGIAV